MGIQTPDRLLFNARSETIASANFWKESFRERRCLIPADGFYEWAKGPGRNRAKLLFTVPDCEPFGMAGVWSTWKNPRTGEREPTFAILTCGANGVMRSIHDRQPTILEPRDYRDWLHANERLPVHLLRLLPDEELQSALVQPEGGSQRQQEGLCSNPESMRAS